MDDDPSLLDLALSKSLFARDEGEAARARAEREGRTLGEILVDEGLLAPRTVTALQAELAKTEFVEAPGGAESHASTVPPPVGALPQAGLSLPCTIGGDFELIELLGQGGMGTVYRGTQISLERTIAVKVIAPQIAGTADARARFLREARSAASINHPHVIGCYAVGEDNLRGLLYMALEFVDGGDVEQLRRQSGGRLPPRRALELLRDCAEGLRAVEAAGMVHRDIKPANLFVTSDGRAKLADLGLARQSRGDDRMTQTGAVVGTPAFMAPEQAEGAEVDSRADIYALGASLYLLVTGTPPFTGPSPLAVVAAVLKDPVADPRTHLPSLGAGVTDLILRAMQRDPEQRFPDTSAFLAAIDAVLAEPGPLLDASPVPARVGVGSPVHAHAIATVPRSKGDEAGKAEGGFAWGKLLVGVGLALFVLLPLLALGGRSGASSSGTPSVVLAQGPESGAGAGAYVPKSSPSPGPKGTPAAAPSAGQESPADPAQAPSASPAGPLTYGSPTDSVTPTPRLSPSPRPAALFKHALRFTRQETRGGDLKVSPIVGGAADLLFDPSVSGGFARAATSTADPFVLDGAELTFVLAGVEVDKEGEDAFFADQGIATRAGYFCEVGLRDRSSAEVSAAELFGNAIWVTAQYRHQLATLTLRSINERKRNTRLGAKDPGVAVLAMEKVRLRDLDTPITVKLEVNTRGWKWRVESEALGTAKTKAGAWSGKFRLSSDSPGYVWAHGGNWSEGRGRGRVTLALQAPRAR